MAQHVDDIRNSMVFSGLAVRRFAPGPRLAVCVALVAGLCGCTSTNVAKDLPRGDAAYAVIGPVGSAPVPKYRIGPADLLQITTFNEPGLTFPEVPVDADGGFSFPFLGRIEAAGMTPTELESTIKSNLDSRYTRNAQVTVFVKTSASQIFSVEGDVVKPGSFQYAGQTTLLNAIARAGSPTDTAKLDEVVIFRFVDGARYAGVFNLTDIREGRVPDPEIYAGDTVVVGYSAVKQAWAQFRSVAPLINAFTRF